MVHHIALHCGLNECFNQILKQCSEINQFTHGALLKLRYQQWFNLVPFYDYVKCINCYFLSGLFPILPTSCLYSSYILSIFSLDPVYFLPTSCLFSPYILTIFSVHPVYFLPTTWLYSPYILTTFSLQPVYFLPTSWLYSPYILLSLYILTILSSLHKDLSIYHLSLFVWYVFILKMPKNASQGKR